MWEYHLIPPASEIRVQLSDGESWLPDEDLDREEVAADVVIGPIRVDNMDIRMSKEYNETGKNVWRPPPFRPIGTTIQTQWA